MRFCVRCLQPDSRPGTAFGDDGSCPACAYWRSLTGIDWAERTADIVAVAEPLATRSGAEWDCIIGVSGGKDSTRQALWVRDRLGLNPLLVAVCYPPEQQSEMGAANLANLVHLDFDLLTLAPDPVFWRRAMRLGFQTFGNWCKSTELALFAGVPQVAIEMDIPLIFWGENPALQLGDLASAGRTGWDGNAVVNLHTLQGGDTSWLAPIVDDAHVIRAYQYPSPSEIKQAGIQTVYLGWALGDWGLARNGEISASFGLRTRTEPPEVHGDLSSVTSLDEDWVSVNQLIKYLKYGFGRATDYVNEEIRCGRLTRDAAVDLVSRYDGVCAPQLIASFCDYIQILESDFWGVVDRFVNPSLFERVGRGVYRRRFEVGVSTWAD